MGWVLLVMYVQGPRTYELRWLLGMTELPKHSTEAKSSL